MIILVDDEDRENEGDLCIAAEKVTPAAVNFMARFGRGLICLAMTDEKARSLELPLMVPEGRTPPASAPPSPSPSRRPAASRTGICAKDRAHTILTAVAPGAKPDRPGPPRPRLPAAGPARAACWCAPARPRARSTWRGWPASSRPAVICEIMNDDGTMARMPELRDAGPGARHPHRVGRRPDPLPDDPATRWCAAPPQAPLPTEYGEVHRGRLRERRRQEPARGPGDGRLEAPGSRCWSGFTPSA